jgi:hypothetical protein
MPPYVPQLGMDPGRSVSLAATQVDLSDLLSQSGILPVLPEGGPPVAGVAHHGRSLPDTHQQIVPGHPPVVYVRRGEGVLHDHPGQTTLGWAQKLWKTLLVMASKPRGHPGKAPVTRGLGKRAKRYGEAVHRVQSLLVVDSGGQQALLEAPLHGHGLADWRQKVVRCTPVGTGNHLAWWPRPKR